MCITRQQQAPLTFVAAASAVLQLRYLCQARLSALEPNSDLVLCFVDGVQSKSPMTNPKQLQWCCSIQEQ